MDLIKLFNPDYLFDPFTGSEFSLRWMVYSFFIVTMIIGIYLPKWLKKRPQAKLEAEFFGNVPHRLTECAVFGLLFTFFRDQNVPYLGMRVWMLLIFVVLLAYLVYIWRNYQKNFALRLAVRTERKGTDKYKPRAKKGRK